MEFSGVSNRTVTMNVIRSSLRPYLSGLTGVSMVITPDSSWISVLIPLHVWVKVIPVSRSPKSSVNSNVRVIKTNMVIPLFS